MQYFAPEQNTAFYMALNERADIASKVALTLFPRPATKASPEDILCYRTCNRYRFLIEASFSSLQGNRI
jgi:hypothetical protein